MKFITTKSELEPALAIASAGINDKGGDISSHFVFRPHPKGMEVLAWNGRLGAVAVFKAEKEDEQGSDDDMFTVEGWRLRQWVGAAGDVTISLSESNGKVTIKSPTTRGTLRSLDTSNFQFWDETFKKAKKVANIEARALRDALSNAKNFIYEKDTQRPEYAVCEAAKGALQASDTQALSISVVPGLGKASFRIHHKDLPTVISFLGNAEGDVEILEHDNALFVRIDEHKALTVGKPNTAFPEIRYLRGPQDPIQWTASKQEVLAGISQLSSTAERSDVKLRFSFDPEKNSVAMSMRSMEGTEDKHPISVSDVKIDRDHHLSEVAKMVRSRNKDKLEKMDETEAADFVEQQSADIVDKSMKLLQERGFLINYHHLKKVLAAYDGDEVVFGVSPMGKGGFLRFMNIRNTEEGKNGKEPTDMFLTILAWIRDLSK